MSLLTNLVGYYKLDNTTDNSGDGYTLTNNNSVTFDSAKIGNGADFGSSNTNKSLTSNSLMGMTYAVSRSLSVWVKMITQPATSVQVAIAGMFFNTNPGNQSAIYYNNTSGTYYLHTGQGETYANTLTTGAWFHIVVTGVYGGNSQMYLNGTLLGTHSLASTNFTAYSPGGLSLGNIVTSQYASCQVDEVGVWSRVLTSTEVTQLYNSGVGLQYPFTVTPPPTANTNQAFFAYFN